jgi:hypothetical protein
MRGGKRIAGGVAQLASVAMASLAFGATKESEFGPPPTKCGGGIFGGSGCYGYDVGPDSMDDAGNGNINISPHVVEVGGYIAMSTEGEHGDWTREVPGLTALGPCEKHQSVCGFKAIEPTEGWQRYEMRFGFGAREQDYYGVLAGPATIIGRVVDQEGTPVPDVLVEATGPTNEDTRTTLDGRYSMRVIRPGTYKVTAKSGDSRKTKPKSRTLTLAEGGIGKAGFQMETRCPGKGGREKPKSGFYSDGQTNIQTDSELYYSCRSGRVVITSWYYHCEGHPNQQHITETISTKVREEGGDYSFRIPYDRDVNNFLVAEGRFTSRTTVAWRVQTPRFFNEPVGCNDFAKRFSGKWQNDIGDGFLPPDDTKVGPPEQPLRPGLFGAPTPWR